MWGLLRDGQLLQGTIAASGAMAIPELGARVSPVLLCMCLHICISLLFPCSATFEKTPEHTGEGSMHAIALTHHCPLDQHMHLRGLKQLKELSNHVLHSLRLCLCLWTQNMPSLWDNRPAGLGERLWRHQTLLLFMLLQASAWHWSACFVLPWACV